ncbi:hypothetical protein [Pseudacidovorax sp. RU35E]|uniref:hypothetical protein n=1 Tax=Pseudacidovorax sp. RU35E TaxID=1907403 RepID=UPI000954A142|nr:hypothetical protein [Pseudacidovorax sp. RU35E]SIQ58210.1 hypothetical protein SAMN05880557_104343 [Pseudacidovorax sp. RU35E]
MVEKDGCECNAKEQFICEAWHAMKIIDSDEARKIAGKETHCLLGNYLTNRRQNNFLIQNEFVEMPNCCIFSEIRIYVFLKVQIWRALPLMLLEGTETSGSLPLG